MQKNRHQLSFALWPEESTRAELAAVLELFPRQISDRWARPDGLHITLASLGNTDVGWRDDVKAVADDVKGEDFEIWLDRITYWPELQHLCLTPSSVPVALEQLAADLAKNLLDFGFDMEKRLYRPYLTLARRSAYPPSGIQLERPILWKATSFVLIESRPKGLGLVYEMIETWPLSKLKEVSGEAIMADME